MIQKLPIVRIEEASRLGRLAVDDSRNKISAAEAALLEALLRGQIDGEVRFDNGTRALYATDGSNYRQAPIGVVIPRHVQDVETAVRLAREHGAPILSRGGGTSLAGQCCNVAVVIDFSKYMHHVVDIDAEKRLGRCPTGLRARSFPRDGKETGGAVFRARSGDA